MRWHGRRVTVYAYAQPTDMRKGFDGLSALVTQGLQGDPLSGDAFIFVSRDRVRAKVLQWNGTGLCIYAKRLEKGRFARPAWSKDAGRIRWTIRTINGVFARVVDGMTLMRRGPPTSTAKDGNRDRKLRAEHI